MSKQTVLITGGSGMIGSRLSELLTDQYNIAWLVRSKKTNAPYQQYIWDIDKGVMDKKAIEVADHIVHLAGENIGDRGWSEKNKKKILNSRVQSSALLRNKLQSVSHNVKTIVCASAIGIYNDAGDLWQQEDSKDLADNFLADVVKKWEEGNSHYGLRTVIFRFGIVLSEKGGAFPQLYQPLHFGVAPLFRNGKHYQSWIHIDDLCQLLKFAAEHSSMNGIYNAVASNPVTYYNFMDTIQKNVKWPTVKIPVPSFMMKLLLGEKSVVVLEGCRVSSNRIRSAGFQFIYNDIDAALKNILKK